MRHALLVAVALLTLAAHAAMVLGFPYDPMATTARGSRSKGGGYLGHRSTP